MPTLNDLLKDPSTGAVLNPGDFTPGQLSEAMRQGLVTFQNGQAALRSASAPANNAPDIAASATAPAAARLDRFAPGGGGTNAEGQVNVAPPAAPAPASAAIQAPAPAAAPQPGAGIAYPRPPAGGAPVGGGPALGLLPGSGVRPGWQPTSRDTTVTSKAGPYSDTYAQSALGALGARRDLAGAQYDADSVQGALSSNVNKLATIHDEADALSDRVRQQSQVSQLKDYHDKVTSLITDANNTKINPNAWFDDKPVAGKVLTALGLAVAGFGYGYSGRGVNPTEYMNSQIKSSIESQVANLNNKRAAVTEARQNLMDLREQFGSDDKAALAAELQARQFYINHLQQQAADISAPVMNRLRAKQYASDLQKDNTATLDELDKRTVSDISTKGAEKYNAPGSGVPRKVGQVVTLADGSKAVIPFADAKEAGLTPGGQLDVEKTRAEIDKTKAETRKLGANGAGTLDDIAREIHSTSIWSDPDMAVSKHFQGTEGYKAQNAIDRWNSEVKGAAHLKYGARTPEAQAELMAPYIIRDNDVPSSIATKIAGARKDLSNISSSAGAGAEPE